ncbi:unnamed protein product [Ascophyllum nodosum]
MMSFAGAEWKGIEVEADETNFEISYEAGSDKPYRIVFTEDGVKSVFMFGESGCVTTMEVGSEVYDVEDPDDGDDVTVKLKSSTRRLHSENHTNREDKGEDQHRFDSRRLYACDDCETTWDVVCDEGVPCVCNLRDFGAPLSAAAEHAVETLCEKFGNACSTDGGEEACDGQCILSPTPTPTPPPSGSDVNPCVDISDARTCEFRGPVDSPAPEDQELFLKNCGLVDEDLDDISACFDKFGRSKIRYLFMTGNELTFLPVDIFSGTNIEELWLSSNQLKSLPAGLFESGVPVDLYIDNNQLKTLPEDIFLGTSSMFILSIRNNNLLALPEGIFSGLTSLFGLRLSGNPDLECIPTNPAGDENVSVDAGILPCG